MPDTMTDEQILGLPDSAESEISSESPETAETASSVETQPEETAEETALRPDQAKDETLPPPKQADKAQQPDKTASKEGTSEQSQETIAAKAAELDRSDQAFLTGDVAGMAETFEQMFGENPQACADALWMGLRFLEQRAPEQLSNFSRIVVSDELGKQAVWNSLERIYESAQKAGAQETLMLLDKLAGGLRLQYGLGPATPAAQEAEWQSYTKNVGAMMEKSVDADIMRAFGSKFSSVQPDMRGELMTAARFAVRDLLSKDRTLGAAFQKLNKAYSVKEGVRIYFDVLEPRVRSIVPRIVQNLISKYGDLFKNAAVAPKPKPATKPAPAVPEPPRSMAEARAKGMTLSEILKATEGDQAPNGSYLTQDEADKMSEREILDSPRIPQHRKPWRPESIFDSGASQTTEKARGVTANGKVGKGSPPEAFKWKPGQSGNPSGKPSAHREVIVQAVRDMLAQVDPKLNKSLFERLLEQCARRALQGSKWHMGVLLDYGLGKPTQILEHSGGVPIQLVTNVQLPPK